MGKTAKRKAPSRARYEEAHPTVSCRVPRELYDRLRAIKHAEGKSFADILKTGLGILEVQTKDEAGVRKKVYTEGYKKGHAEAERLYKVVYGCNVCGGLLTVTSTQEKEAIKRYMQAYGWGHAECHKKRQ